MSLGAAALSTGEVLLAESGDRAGCWTLTPDAARTVAELCERAAGPTGTGTVEVDNIGGRVLRFAGPDDQLLKLADQLRMSADLAQSHVSVKQ